MYVFMCPSLCVLHTLILRLLISFRIQVLYAVATNTYEGVIAFAVESLYSKWQCDFKFSKFYFNTHACC